MDFWLARKTRMLAAGYRQLLSHVDNPATSVPSNRALPDQPRQLLFVCENMWEHRKLLPELQKICPTRFIDLAR